MLTDRIPSKADIRLIRSLGQKKFRQEHGLFVVEGEKMVGEALTQKRYQVEAVYRTSDIGEEVMGRMSHLSSPSPALAVLRIPPEEMQDNAPAPALPSGLCLGLDSVRDPGNVGTILRLADWFGIGTVYLSPDCVDLYNPKTVQATMGSIFRQRAVTCDLHALVRGCTAAGIPVYATALDGEDIRSAALDTTRALILMGSERDGLSPALMAAATRRLHIPSFASNPDGAAESLNVAIATAVTCYEFRRR
ncbi:tRNA/rRNA methyltransferase (SpoU) [Alistipes sp. CAG:831]|nr:tRNA/rRNA methyltransferase (SpoU) [Alistipes sp. CAG:831]